VPTGYAGGLGPDNLAEELRRIEEVAGDAEVWIDMETNVRTAERFDLDKVRRCYDLARPWLSQDVHTPGGQDPEDYPQ
jgi:hypothetical protein